MPVRINEAAATTRNTEYGTSFAVTSPAPNAASAILALEEYCPTDTETGREYRTKAAALRKTIGEASFKIED